MSKKIDIPLSEEDLQKLIEGKDFEWTFNNVDVNIFREDLKDFNLRVVMDNGKEEILVVKYSDINDIRNEIEGLINYISEYKTINGKIITSDKIRRILSY